MVLQRKVADREANSTALRMNSARFPARKTLEDFNPDYKPSLRRDVLAHLAIGLGIKACQAGYPVLFDTAAGWVNRLTDAHQHHGGLDKELKRLRRYKLLIIDELGYIPFDADAANLFFQLVASRYEQGSLLITSNLSFSRWGEIFTDDVVAAAMIDRLIHHAEVLTLDGESYRTRMERSV